MSTVVGLKYKGDIWLGADSLASTEDGEIRPLKAKKIFRNGPYLIGFIGSVRGGQILFPDYFEPPRDIKDLPDAIIEQCEEKGCLVQTDDQRSAHGCNFLVGYKGKLFEILIDFQLNEIDDYTAVGAGSTYAIGSFYTSANIEGVKLSPEDRVMLALKAAATFNSSTGGDLIIEKL